MQICLGDRSLMPGDIVARKENGREKICGYCRHVKSVASVHILGSDQVLYNVKSEDLHPLEVTLSLQIPKFSIIILSLFSLGF